MKNVSKVLLFAILVGAGYFFGITAYGADCPAIFGGYICNPSVNDVCNNSGGKCSCNGVIINHGVTCSDSIDPTADGVTGTITNGNICLDADGCMCGGVFYNKGDTCIITSSDTTKPILTALNVSVVNKTASFGFDCNEDNVKISCLGSCGSCSITANAGNNNITFSNLNNGNYNNCSIIGQDSAGNNSIPLNIPGFIINYTPVSGGGGGGGGGSSMCTDNYLVCKNGIYELKSGYYCIGGDLGKTCNVSTGTGNDELLEIIKKEKSVVYEYTPQGVMIRIYVPKYKQSLIRRTVLSLNRNLYKAINKKLLKVTDPSYMIENYENLTSDSKIIVYKEIGSITKLYNDFLGYLYLVLDMKQKEYLPLARTYLESYFKEFARFQK